MPFNSDSLRELMNKRDLSVEDVARRLGRDERSVFRYLAGHSPGVKGIDELYQLAARFHLEDLDFYQPPMTKRGKRKR